MTRQSGIGITLVVTGLLLTGCVSKKITMTYKSDPPGASFYKDGDTQSVGYMPFTVDYELSPEHLKQGYAVLEETKAVWASGVSLTVSDIRLDLKKNRKFIYTFTRPDQYPGRETDLQFARELEVFRERDAQHPVKTIQVTFQSDPPGALIFNNFDNQNRGYAPVTLQYEVTEENRKRGFLLVKGENVKWVSGATASIPSLQLNLHIGNNQEFIFNRPDVPGLEEDRKFAIELKELIARQRSAQIEAQVEANLAAQERARAEAHENAQIIQGLFLGIAAGMQNSAGRTNSPGPTNPFLGAFKGLNEGLQKSLTQKRIQEESAKPPERWMKEGDGDRRNMRTGELEMNMGKGGSLNTTTGELRHGAGGGDTFGSGGYRQAGQDEKGNYTADFYD